MKLLKCKNEENYLFSLEFDDGKTKKIDLFQLIKNKVAPDELGTAHIDQEWGCLEFKNGMVDIEPKTLYNFCFQKTANS